MGDVEGSGVPSPGWYVDPGGQQLLRWWDGGAWTDHLMPPEGSDLPPPEPSGSGRSTAFTVIVGLLAVVGALTLLSAGACVIFLFGLS